MNNRLTIQDLAGVLADKTGKKKSEAELFLRTIVSVVSDKIMLDKLVKIRGIGTFKVVLVESRESIHVNTKERFVIPEHYKFSFLPDRELKELVNEPFSFFEATELVDGVEFPDSEMEAQEENTGEKEKREEFTEDVIVEASDENVEKPSLEENLVEIKETKEEIIPTSIEEVSVNDIDVKQEDVAEVNTIEEKETKVPVVGDTVPIAQDLIEYIKKKDNTQITSNSFQEYMKWGAVFLLLIIIAIGGYLYIDFYFNSNKGRERTSMSVSKEKELKEKGENRKQLLFDTLENESSQEREEKPVGINNDEKEVVQYTTESKILAKEEIKAGDRLTLLALKYYNSKLFWVYIYEFNKDKIEDPNNIPIGTKIFIPVPELYGINAKDRGAVEKAAALQTQILSGK